MAKYVNFNSNTIPQISDESKSVFSRVMSAGGALNNNTMLIIGVVLLFGCLAIFYYFYYMDSYSSKYRPNSEQVPVGSSNTAEVLFFYANWCPHCKAAKPIWDEFKSEYENKSINGYKIIFTEVDCSEETSEVEKIINQYNVEGYPTIKLIKDGQVIDYDAKPSKETLNKFLTAVL